MTVDCCRKQSESNADRVHINAAGIPKLKLPTDADNAPGVNRPNEMNTGDSIRADLSVIICT